MNILKLVLVHIFFLGSIFAGETDNFTNQSRPKILVGSPIRQKNTILREFLVSLLELDKQAFDMDYFFIDDNIDPQSKSLLRDFASLDHKVILKDMKADPFSGDQFVCNEVTHFWKDAIVWKVAGFKDEIIEYARTQKYDYLFLIDSDLVLNPQTINQLISAKKDIISNIFWTKWQPNQPELPQVWVSDTYNLFETQITEKTTQDSLIASQTQFLEKLKKPGIYEVGGLGACTLISKKALSKPISFKKISNLTFWGEDRHFCIRATALGLKLHVDTHYPAFHIYREQELNGVEEFKSSSKKLGESKSPRITLSMIMKNEANAYLTEMLMAAREYITDAVIIDDASDDNSVEIAENILKGIPHKIIKNKVSMFRHEVDLRKLQWNETVKTNPEWIVFLDADQIFEKSFKDEVKKLVKSNEYDAYAFRLYDFWDQNHYRDDEFWCAHKTYRPFLVRYVPGISYTWRETSQHCGSYPQNINYFKTGLSNLRLKHYGWAKEEDRIKKYQRYMSIDPECKFGWKPQQESILDKHPHLSLWIE